MHKFERAFLWMICMLAACIPGGLAIHFWWETDGHLRYWAIAFTVVAEGFLIFAALMRDEAKADGDKERLKAIGFMTSIFVLIEVAVLLLPARELAGSAVPPPAVAGFGAFDAMATIRDKRERLTAAEAAGSDRDLQLAITRAGVALSVDGDARAETGAALTSAYALLDAEEAEQRAALRSSGLQIAWRALWEGFVLLAVMAVIAAEMRLRRAVSRTKREEPPLPLGAVRLSPVEMQWTLDDFLNGTMPVVAGYRRQGEVPSAHRRRGRAFYLAGEEDMVRYARRVHKIREALAGGVNDPNVLAFPRAAN